MLVLIGIVLSLVGLALILFPFVLRWQAILQRFSGARPVACPENHQSAVVRVDARHAAATGLHGRPDVRLCDCTRWPDRAICGQPCLPQALEEEPRGEVRIETKPIHHLPILLAAFAAWCLGALWHSQILFRTRWTQALGLTYAQVRQIRWWYAPHLLTAAVCLLFAYGVAWLLVVGHRKGVLQGVLMSLLLCGVVLAASSYGIAKLPHDLLATEAGYIALAALTVGAIVGGLNDKLVLPSH
ncbi:MAG: DUF1761 domain-containing protein [Acidobacteriaceae bacterium]